MSDVPCEVVDCLRVLHNDKVEPPTAARPARRHSELPTDRLECLACFLHGQRVVQLQGQV